MNKETKNKIWAISKPAQDFPQSWFVVPALDVIELLENEEQSSGDKK